MLITVKHTDGYPVLLNTKEGVYYSLSGIVAHNLAKENQIIMNDRYFDFFETIELLLNSDKKKAIVPVFCIERKQKNKRFKVKLLSGLKSGEFFNVERINNSWYTNEIDNIKPNSAYLVFLEKNKQADNECLIIGTKKVDPK